MSDASSVPRCDADPGWRLAVVGDDPVLRRVHESLLTVAGGRVGTRGTREEDGTGYQPLVMVAGAYTASNGDDMPRPVPGPLWFRHDLSTDRLDTEQRVLDLRTGVLHREGSDPRPIRSIRFASLARPGILVQRLEGPAEAVAAGLAPLEPGLEYGVVDTTTDGDTTWVRVRDGGAVTAAIWTTVTTDGSRRVVDRIAAFDGHDRDLPSAGGLKGRLAAARETGVDRLLAEHRGRWQDRWRDAAVSIGGDPDLELATRFALCHLIASVADSGEAIVGARGLSGPGYAGHVFWDADVFVLPFLAATHPASARAMLEYRLRRLPAARDRAREHGYDGARFPWESADTGADVTPRSAIGLTGETMPIRTGDLEEHVVAAIAWAAWQYTAWSGDRAFLTGAGRPLLIETARYWASRIDRDADGTAHLRGVIGPDEYHEMVDDNAYTNVMARWNLRRAAELSDTAPDDDVTANEVKTWRQLAEALVDGYDLATGRYEQFAGYDHLEPLLVSTVATPPVAADVLLGRERVATTQVIKEADVLMLHHLVPDDVAPGSLQPNLARYLPHTAHGSSLSPAVHASLLARAGRPDDALDLLRLAARLDLDDLTGTTAAGLHLATMGGVWQALTTGFAGLAPTVDGLRLDPHLPTAWSYLELHLQVRGAHLRLWLGHDQIEIERDRDLTVAVTGTAPLPHRPLVRLRRTRTGWQEDPT